MSRGPRLDMEGALHHVMMRDLEGRRIFLSDTDRMDLVGRLATVIPETDQLASCEIGGRHRSIGFL